MTDALEKAAYGDTITLRGNLYENSLIDEDKDVTIGLNGLTIAGTYTRTSPGIYYASVITDYGTLTFPSDRFSTYAIVKTDHMPGGGNGDGKVNITVVQDMLQYVNRQDVFVVQEALDVDGDGKADISDVQPLPESINKQNGTIFWLPPKIAQENCGSHGSSGAAPYP